MSTGLNPLATSIDLFCGAGGLTLGLESAGFRSALSSDHWSPAVATFEQNHARVPILAADAHDLTSSILLTESGLGAAPDLVVGGPPCQGFSSAGSRKAGDLRNTLVGVFARLIAETSPRGFIFENVEGFLTAEGGAYVDALLDPLIEAGYRVGVYKLNVANWGVPQLRKRVVALGLLNDDPPAPQPTHRAWGAPGAHLAGSHALPPTPTLAEALAGLPPACAKGSTDSMPSDHEVMPISPLDLERMRSLLPGQTMRDLPEHLRHQSYARRANRRVADGTSSDKRGGAPAGLRRLEADQPSKAITSAATREFVHPTEDRPLTLREAARLQTFPDDFVFIGNRSERQTLVGNAVPPRFAAALARTMYAALGDFGGTTGDLMGGLAAFKVSESAGRSPALRDVEQRVLRRHPIRSTQGALPL